MYIAVINPALPAVVYTMPICWKMLAAARNAPQHIPPMIVFLRYAAYSFRLMTASFSFSDAMGKSDMAPTAIAARAILAALNVMGSMSSMPTRWNTNAVPQIIAVSISSIFPSILLLFLIPG